MDSSNDMQRSVAHPEVISLMTPGVVLYCLANAKRDAIPDYQCRLKMGLKRRQIFFAHQCRN